MLHGKEMYGVHRQVVACKFRSCPLEARRSSLHGTESASASCSGFCLAFLTTEQGNSGGPKPSMLGSSHFYNKGRFNGLAPSFAAAARVKHTRLSSSIARL